MRRLLPIPTIIALSTLLFIAMIVGLAMGAVAIPVGDIISILTTQNTHTPSHTIVMDIRLPRVVLAAVIGAVLAVCGVVMQGLFRNPLADPSLIGVTAGASLGASVVIVWLSTYSQYWVAFSFISLGAFVGGATAVILVYCLANHNGRTSVATMLLAGIAISALSASINSFLEFHASNDMLRRISLWQMGSLSGASVEQLCLALPMLIVLLIIFMGYSQSLNALLLGESEARHLGINTERLKKTVIVVVAAGMGVTVALVGTIAFVGLVIPHILRLLIGPDHTFLMPASALAGALLLVLADTFARVILAPTELPIGIVTALIGAPFFIGLLKQPRVHGLQ